MTEDREHDRTEERDGAARPVTAAARRERRASARDAAERDRTASTKAKTSSASSQARTRRARPAEGSATAASVATEKKARPTPKRDRAEKRPNAVARLLRFFREVVGELRKVIWPTRKQQITYTVVVVVFVAFVVALVYGLDAGFSKLVFTVFA